jgi:hypothetical protein
MTGPGVEVSALTPAGPLHPTDFAISLLIGVVVATGLRRSRWLAPVGAVAALAGYGWRHGGGTIVAGLVDRPAPGLSVVALLVAAAIGWRIQLRLRRMGIGRGDPVGVITVVSLALIWAIVPDTEAPLMLGTTLAPVVGWALVWDCRFVECRKRSEIRPVRRPAASGAVLALCVVAASVGSTGRTARSLPALTGTVLVVLAGLVLAELMKQADESVSGSVTRAERAHRRRSLPV